MLQSWLKTALLVVLTLLVLNTPLIIGVYCGRWDANDFFGPYYTLIADHARQGQLLLWTPLVDGGCPSGVDPQIGALSPLTVGMAAITGPSEFGFRCYWLLIWALGGLGMLFLARHLGAPLWAGFVAAIGYMFSGIYTGHAEHTTFLFVMSLLPWTLWRLDAAILTRRLFPAAQGGAFWGLAAMSGYPGLFFIGSCYLALWTLARVLQSGHLDRSLPGRRPRSQETILVLAVFLLVTAVVLAPVYVGFVCETRGYSDRSGPLPRELAINDNALHPLALGTAASPYLAILGAMQKPRLWPTDVSTCSVYLCPVLLGLALTGLLNRPRDGFRWFLACVALLCLGCALGGVLPLRGWLYDLLPPMRYFRHAGIFRCYTLFTVAVMALLATRDLAEESDRGAGDFWRRWSIVAWTTAVAGALCFGVLCWMAQPGGRQLLIVLVAASQVVLVWFGTALLTLVGRPPSVTLRHHITQRYLTILVVADALLSIVLMKPAMYDSRKRVWTATEAAYSSSLDLSGQGMLRLAEWQPEAGPLDACLLAKVPVLNCTSSLTNLFHKQLLKSPVLSQSALGTERVWFSPQASLVPQEMEVLRHLAAHCDALGQPCLVVSDPLRRAGASTVTAEAENSPAEVALLPGTADVESLPPAQRVPASVVTYVDRELSLDVVVPEDGWLLVTDRWARGWRCTVNGQPQKLWIGNFIFRAVPLRQGASRVEFSYTPAGYPWLLWASWSALAAVAMASCLGASSRLPEAGHPSSMSR